LAPLKQNEVRRVLDLVASGVITPDEGERLLSSIEPRGRRVRCVYCAEMIPAGREICSECGSNQCSRPVFQKSPPPHQRSRWAELSGLQKSLVIYMVVASSLVILSGFGTFFVVSETVQVLLASLGLVSAGLICKGSPTGWMLGILWSAMQIVEVQVAGVAINRQWFHVGASFNVNAIGFGVNLVGAALFILFLKTKPQASSVTPMRYATNVPRRR